MGAVALRGWRDVLPRQLRVEGKELGKEGYVQCSWEGGTLFFSLKFIYTQQHPGMKRMDKREKQAEKVSSSHSSSFRLKALSLDLVGSVAQGHLVTFSHKEA